jgi:hypothetical protein
MDAAKAVTATFTRIQYTLSVSKTGTGGGTVTSSTPGTPIILATGVDCLDTLVIDSTDVYFADNSCTYGGTAPLSLKRVAKDGGTVTTLFSGSGDRGISSISLDNVNAYLQYNGYGSAPIVQVPKTGGAATTLASATDKLIGVIGSDVYYSTGFCCIYKVPINGGAPTQVLGGGNWVRSSGVDSTSIYFVEYFSRDVRKLAVASGTLTTLISGNSTEGYIFIDSNNVYLNLNTLGTQSIKKISKNGGPVTTIVDNNSNAFGFVSDDVYVYFTENGDLKKVSVNGGAPTLLLQNSNINLGFGDGPVMAVDNLYLYWRDTPAGTIMRMSKSGAILPGIDCGATCSASFDAGTVVALTPTPNATSTFTGWSGACSGTGPCAVTMDAAKSVTATFTTIQYALSVSKTGTGGGTVASSPAGITCGATCSALFDTGTVVTLTATPDGASTFAGWSGACTGTGSCIVTMDAAKAVTATFTLIPYSLSVSLGGTGSGVVTSSPAGINCGATCSASYDSGTVVTLTATPGTGSGFAGWSGDPDCADGTVTLGASKSCTATFDLNLYTLTVTRAGSGSGTVTSVPAGINCGVDCTENYAYSTVVVLTATPGVGSSFTGWSGDADCADGSVTLDVSKSCTATFTLNTHTLTLTTAGTGSGVVTGAGVYGYGVVATVTATANTGSTFAGWSGPNGAECATGAVNMVADKSCTATFSLNMHTLTLTTAGTGSGAVTGAGVYNYGSVATVTATADTGSTFGGWSGLDVAECATGSVSMTADKSCTATFDLIVLPPSILGSISTRALVLTGDNEAIAGLIISGTGTKHVLIRAFGPTLSSFGVAGPLANPVLDLYWDDDNNPTTPALLLVSNDNWGTDVTSCAAPIVSCGTAAEILATGKSADSYAPSNPNRHLDAAVLVTLPPGTYTAKVRGVSGGTGVALAAVNDLDTTPTATLASISTRAFVGTGDNEAIAGLIISGTADKQVLLRGFGPTLSSFGVSGPLANPVLDLYWDDDNNPTTPALLLVSNDNWGTDVTSCAAPIVACGTAAEILATGKSADSYAPANPNRHLDAAMLVTLPPGTYTAKLRGVSGGTGVGLVAVNEIAP